MSNESFKQKKVYKHHRQMTVVGLCVLIRSIYSYNFFCMYVIFTSCPYNLINLGSRKDLVRRERFVTLVYFQSLLGC